MVFFNTPSLSLSFISQHECPNLILQADNSDWHRQGVNPELCLRLKREFPTNSMFILFKYF